MRLVSGFVPGFVPGSVPESAPGSAALAFRLLPSANHSRSFSFPFEHELRHVETYLSLEKKRFGDKLSMAAVNMYKGEFMNQYSWAEFTNAYLKSRVIP